MRFDGVGVLKRLQGIDDMKLEVGFLSILGFFSSS